MKQVEFITRAKMLLHLQKVYCRNQDRVPEYMKHITDKVRSQEAAWEKYLLPLQNIQFLHRYS